MNDDKLSMTGQTLYLMRKEALKMGFYKKCPACGASLDPGEKCDCEDETNTSNHEKLQFSFVKRENGQKIIDKLEVAK